jgi:RimJ/RimL family protein N-acetyltransferase
MMTPPTITTERLIIEPIAMKHWEPYAIMWADPRMTEFIGGKPRTRNESWYKFAASTGLWNVIGYGYWAFVERKSGTLLGVGGLSHWERDIKELDGFPEAGWGFAPDGWGKGYATEAMTAVLAWSDGVLEAPEVRCIIDPGNLASHRVAEKLGFVKIGYCDAAIGPTNIYARKLRG